MKRFVLATRLWRLLASHTPGRCNGPEEVAMKRPFARFSLLAALSLIALGASLSSAQAQENCASVLSQRTSDNYYAGLLYALGATPGDIISTDPFGRRVVHLSALGGYWSYQVTPYSVEGVSVDDKMFLLGPGMGAPSGRTFGIDPLGPYGTLTDKIADQSTISCFISSNPGTSLMGTNFNFLPAGLFETRDNYFGEFLYTYTPSG